MNTEGRVLCPDVTPFPGRKEFREMEMENKSISMEDYVAPTPVAVYPIYDCPHVATSLGVGPQEAGLAFLHSTCSDCKSKLEPWLCLG